MDYMEQGAIFDKLSDLLQAESGVEIARTLHTRYCGVSEHSINECEESYATNWKDKFRAVNKLRWEFLESIGVEPDAVLRWQAEVYPARKAALEAGKAATANLA